MTRLRRQHFTLLLYRLTRGILLSKSVFDLQLMEQLKVKYAKQKKRANLLHKAGHHICYGIDGAGNINIRERVVSIIYQFSDYTVTFSENELRILFQFLNKNL